MGALESDFVAKKFVTKEVRRRKSSRIAASGGDKFKFARTVANGAPEWWKGFSNDSGHCDDVKPDTSWGFMMFRSCS